MSKAHRAQAVRAAMRPLAKSVAEALEAQNARLPSSAARDANLAALRDGAAAVVTGQQVGLFLGPLYTVYKAASAIKLARALQEETGEKVVPVFWLQTEDHDLVEIASCTCLTAHGKSLRLAVPVASDNRVPVAHAVLPPDVEGQLGALRAALVELPHGREHLARLEAAYRPGVSWADAFAQVLSALFAEEGLVFIDPRDPAFGSHAAPLHRRAIDEAGPIASALIERSAALERQGLPVQIHVREGAPLSFFHPDGAAGPRFRLAPAAQGFSLVGDDRELSLDALRRALEEDPLRFSTSALLRPILQDTLLPTAAYVGGPAELAYFGQLQPLYDHFGLRMPLVVPRAKLRVVDDQIAQTCSRVKATPEEASALSEEALLERLQSPGNTDAAAALEDTLVLGFEQALNKATQDLRVPPAALATPLRKTKSTVMRAARKLRANYEKALAQQNRDAVEGVKMLRRSLMPDGVPQERVYGLSGFAARIGERPFIERVLEVITPFEAKVKDLRI